MALIAVALVFCAAALAEVVWFIVCLIRGILAPRVTAIVIGIAALAVFFTCINKAK